MRWSTTAILAAAIIVTAATTAEARKHHPQTKPVTQYAALECDNNGRCRVQHITQSEGRLLKRSRAAKRGRGVERVMTLNPPENIRSGIVRSSKTGATARVSPKHAAKFQAFVNDLEAGGATIKFMGGYRAGKCWQGGKHPCGLALDYCQYARGVVDKRCNLPGRAAVASIARKYGLFEGGQWCNNDYGHVEAGGSSPCGRNLWGAVERFKKRHARMAKLH